MLFKHFQVYSAAYIPTIIDPALITSLLVNRHPVAMSKASAKALTVTQNAIANLVSVVRCFMMFDFINP
jgi:hypothetical protein